jgi:hypothetical protein
MRRPWLLSTLPIGMRPGRRSFVSHVLGSAVRFERDLLSDEYPPLLSRMAEGLGVQGTNVVRVRPTTV